jgi:hypothetical protein
VELAGTEITPAARTAVAEKVATMAGLGTPTHILHKVQDDGKQIFHVEYRISDSDDDDATEESCRKRLRAAATRLKQGLRGESTAVWPHPTVVTSIGADPRCVELDMAKHRDQDTETICASCRSFRRRAALGIRARRLFGSTGRNPSHPLGHPLHHRLGHPLGHPLLGHLLRHRPLRLPLGHPPGRLLPLLRPSRQRWASDRLL